MSFVVRAPSGHWLHHNFVVAVLNDLFGVQARGGCSCAGPYGHRLLGIDLERSHEFEREITGGCEGIKPGWVRVNFNYFLSDTVADYVMDAVRLVARDGWRLLGDYLFEPDSRSVAAPRRGGRAADPAAGHRVCGRRRDGRCRARTPAAARSCSPSTCATVPRSSRRRRPPDLTQHAAGLSADFEHLRWFDLPTERDSR